MFCSFNKCWFLWKDLDLGRTLAPPLAQRPWLWESSLVTEPSLTLGKEFASYKRNFETKRAAACRSLEAFTVHLTECFIWTFTSLGPVVGKPGPSPPPPRSIPPSTQSPQRVWVHHALSSLWSACKVVRVLLPNVRQTVWSKSTSIARSHISLLPCRKDWSLLC